MLERYEEELNRIQTNVSEQDSLWKRLETVLSSLTPEQVAFMESNKEVIQKKQRLLEHFNDWLFEKYKREFVSLEPFKVETEDYIKCLEDSVKDFAEKNRQVIQDYDNKVREVEALKAEIEKLKGSDGGIQL